MVPNIRSGNALAKQLTFLGHAGAAGIVLGARVRHPHQPCRQLAHTAAFLRGGTLSCAGTAKRKNQTVQALLTLNTGSSSIKFRLFGLSDDLLLGGKVTDIGGVPVFQVHQAEDSRDETQALPKNSTRFRARACAGRTFPISRAEIDGGRASHSAWRGAVPRPCSLTRKPSPI